MEWLQGVKDIMIKYNIPDWIWKPIMNTESGGNPKDAFITSKESSYGLFQINKKAHPEYSINDLLDPVKNAEIAARDFLTPAIHSMNIDITKPSLRSAQIVYSGMVDPNDFSKGYIPSGGIRPDWSSEETRNRFSINYDINVGDIEIAEESGYTGVNPDQVFLNTKESLIKIIIMIVIFLVGIYALFMILKDNTDIDLITPLKEFAKMKKGG